MYQDVGQCRAEYLGAVDFGPYPNVVRWMDDIAAEAPDFAWLDSTLKKISSFFKKRASKL